MNPWDHLADIFGRGGNEDAIPEYAADNICIAWPSMMRCMGTVFPRLAHLKVLDFGCGGGLFCRKLFSLGLEVTGYDPSAELIKAARANNPEAVTLTRSLARAAQQAPYDLITSIMVFPFIPDIDAAVQKLASLLKPRGLIVYAAFNPEFISDNSDNKIFSSLADNQTGYLELKQGVRIPFFIRTASEYQRVFERGGFRQVYLEFPAFTEAFLKKYPMPFSTRHPEFIIQAFRKRRI